MDASGIVHKAIQTIAPIHIKDLAEVSRLSVVDCLAAVNELKRKDKKIQMKTENNQLFIYYGMA